MAGGGDVCFCLRFNRREGARGEETHHSLCGWEGGSCCRQVHEVDRRYLFIFSLFFWAAGGRGGEERFCIFRGREGSGGRGGRVPQVVNEGPAVLEVFNASCGQVHKRASRYL